MSTQTGNRQDIKMMRLFATLSGKNWLHYATIEATKLVSGGINPNSNTFDLDAKNDYWTDGDGRVLGGVYVKGQKVAADFLENMRFVFDEHLFRWNFRTLPPNS